MVRRRIIEEPMSRLALWSRRLALFALVAALLSIIIVRSGMLELSPALATFGGALALAVLGMLLALAAMVVIWRQGHAGIGHAVSALAIGAVLLAYPAYFGVLAYRLPMINDVATDPVDPPRFEVLARLRPREGANPVAYARLRVAEQQHKAYPDIEPLDVDAAPQAAYDGALDVVTKRKWRVVEARAPQARQRDGHIEAVAHTLIMGFPDDLVIRVRATPDGSRIDVRSASRYGRHDFGTNAARVRSLIEDIDDRLSDAGKKAQMQAQAPARRAPARR
jgi:uncharacterized protein (DUF1499 family)